MKLWDGLKICMLKSIEKNPNLVILLTHQNIKRISHEFRHVISFDSLQSTRIKSN
jgi:hypothetical protein